MIDKICEPYYDIMISIFFGVMIIIIINQLYDQPRTVEIYRDDQKNLHNEKTCWKI
jgi:hypothetical protein